ncbi:MAG: hypothetical protein J0H66_09005 [Solirubrobacterales bacterium]|nr:hypothetical protein [Solirubrobacterales bacterium]OJU95788.1 MAG: hypothetical protein BGO23_09380 [Solirubrobacterales bacterium 67-14]
MKLSVRTATLIASLFALFLVATTVQSAQAAVVRQGTVQVEVSGAGKVTGSGIDCGSDCSDLRIWQDTQPTPTNRLTATPAPGWSFIGFSNCSAVSGKPLQCDAEYRDSDGPTVFASFRDVTAPTVYMDSVSPSDKAGDHVAVTAVAGDGDGIQRVEFLVDGQWVGSVYVGPWSLDLDLSNFSEGTHQIQARAYDPSLNSTTTAAWPIEVDHTAPEITLNSPPAATNAEAPKFSFSSTSNDLSGAWCAIQKQGETDPMKPCERNQGYSADIPTEGVWEFVVMAQDDVGNQGRVTHTFTVDRTAPQASFTSGPAEGSVVKVGNVRYAWNAGDDLPLSQVCSWDSGEESACDGSAARGLAAGTHSFKVVITDQAGNSTTLSRSVTVKKDGDISDPDPDTTDKTAPVVKLVAPKQTVKTARKALRLKVRCNEACSGKVVVKGKGAVKFAGRVSLAKAGVAKLKLKPGAKVRKRLNAILARSLRTHEAQPLKLTATASLKDKAGNTGKASLKFRVTG